MNTDDADLRVIVSVRPNASIAYDYVAKSDVATRIRSIHQSGATILDVVKTQLAATAVKDDYRARCGCCSGGKGAFRCVPCIDRALDTRLQASVRQSQRDPLALVRP